VTVTEINPEAVVLDQLRDQWEKIAAVLVWKLSRDKVVQITWQDLEQFQVEVDAGEAVMFTHGHKESIELSIVTASRAVELARHDAAQRGAGGN
jgi:lauroyl/myristoyl acyltransferase